MSGNSHRNIDVEAIMAEIREEVRKKGPGRPLPDFEQIPIVEPRVRDWTISCAYPMPGNPLKRLYTKIVSKLVRCALFPVTEQMSRSLFQVKVCTDEIAGVIDAQREEIEELTRRVETLERELESRTAGGEE